MWDKKQQLELNTKQQAGSKLGKDYIKAVYCQPCFFNLYAKYIMQNATQGESQTGIKNTGRNINNLRCVHDTTLIAENEEELNSHLIRVKEESEKAGLKATFKKLRS